MKVCFPTTQTYNFRQKAILTLKSSKSQVQTFTSLQHKRKRHQSAHWKKYNAVRTPPLRWLWYRLALKNKRISWCCDHLGLRLRSYHFVGGARDVTKGFEILVFPPFFKGCRTRIVKPTDPSASVSECVRSCVRFSECVAECEDVCLGVF